MYKLFLFFILLAVASCQGGKDQKKNSQNLILNSHSEPPSLDPRKALDLTSISILNMCFEGLIRLDQDGEPECGLAERVEISKDQLTYTFYLRDTKWSDGHPLTAFDFEHTWKTILDSSFPSLFAQELYVIKSGKKARDNLCSLEEVGIRSLDEYTLQVTLEHPVPYFLVLIASHAFYPTPWHICSRFSDWADNAGEHFVGNGPFKMTTWKHHNQIVVEKNPLYWDSDSVRLETITLLMIEDESTELSLFENGEIDWAGSPFSDIPTDALSTIAKKYPLTTYPVSGHYHYIFNTEVSPFNNVNMRKAFALAIDRQAIVENILQKGQLAATGLVPPTMWKDHSPYFKDRDVEAARNFFSIALKEMGLQSPSQLPAITLRYNTTQGHHKIAQAIQEQWFKAFGVKVRLENREWKVFLDEIRGKQFQVARLGALATFDDPITFLDAFRYLDSSNYTGWHHPRFTELLEEAEQMTDPDLRMQTLKAAEALLIEEMPIIPIYFYTHTFLKNPLIQDVRLSELGDIDFRTAYLEK